MPYNLQAVEPALDLPKFRVAEDQPEYSPVTVCAAAKPEFAVNPEQGYNTVIMAFRPDDRQRKAIAEGADIYVSLLTFGDPQQGIIVMAGKDDAGRVFNAKPTE